MKTEVYSWRVSAQRKTELENESRRKGTSLAGLLDQITADWLQERRNARNGDDAEQARIRKRAEAAIGSIAGGDPHRSSQASQRVREILRKRYGRQRPD
jgi:hypothetical protein